MEAAFPFMAVNFIAFLVGGIFAPIALLAIKIKSLQVYAYEWLVLLVPVIVFRLIWLTQLVFKTDGNIAAEPFFIGLIISGIYLVRYIYKESHAKVAPACFGISCLIPVVVYLCMPVMPS
jgi:hypothetical protein